MTQNESADALIGLFQGVGMPNATPSKKRSLWPMIAAAVGLVVLGLLLVSTYFVQREGEKQIAKLLTKNFALLKPTANVTYKRVKFNMWHQTIHVMGLQAVLPSSTDPVTIDRLSVWGVDWDTLKELITTRKPAIPKTIQVEIQGLKIPAEIAGAKGASILETLGYKNIELSTYVSLAISKEAKRFDIDDIDLEIKDVGHITLTLGLDNVKWPNKEQIALLKKNPKAFVEQAQDLTAIALREFSLHYEDESFVTRAVKAFVDMGEDHPVALLDLALEPPSAPQAYPQAPGRNVAASRGPGAAHDALLKFRNFLDKPGTLGISAKPSRSVPLSGIIDERATASFDDLVVKLGLSFEQN